MARNTTLIPQARVGLERLKFETASEVGVTLNQGYNGNIAAHDAGKIGGNMVKKLIAKAESTL
jgi:small acid-soluble spore protein D (minor alpha/beta-type SASP)